MFATGEVAGWDGEHDCFEHGFRYLEIGRESGVSFFKYEIVHVFAHVFVAWGTLSCVDDVVRIGAF